MCVCVSHRSSSSSSSSRPIACGVRVFLENAASLRIIQRESKRMPFLCKVAYLSMEMLRDDVDMWPNESPLSSPCPHEIMVAFSMRCMMDDSKVELASSLWDKSCAAVLDCFFCCVICVMKIECIQETYCIRTHTHTQVRSIDPLLANKRKIPCASFFQDITEASYIRHQCVILQSLAPYFV